MYNYNTTEKDKHLCIKIKILETLKVKMYKMFKEFNKDMKNNNKNATLLLFTIWLLLYKKSCVNIFL